MISLNYLSRHQRRGFTEKRLVLDLERVQCAMQRGAGSPKNPLSEGPYHILGHNTQVNICVAVIQLMNEGL